MIEIRSNPDKVFQVVEHPAIVYDADTFVVIKIGDAVNIKAYYDNTIKALNSMKSTAAESFVDSLRYTELPANQELIDNIFNITGYLQRFINSLSTSENNGRL